MRDVAVIGCGTAGAAAAIFLARAGHRVTVYERVPVPQPIGAGIVLQPTGQSVLARLGLLAPIVAKGARLDGLVCVTAEGRTIVDLTYELVDGAVFGLGLHRGVLFDTLLAAVRRETIDLRLGADVTGLRRGRDERVRVLGPGGEHLGTHDLVVVADGARSRLREHTDLARKVTVYPWGALWFVAKDPESRFTRRLHQTVRGTRRMLGLLPTGRGPDDADPVPNVSLYWSLRCDTLDAWRRAGLAPWRDEILDLNPAAEPVMDQIADLSAVTLAVYHDVVMRRWHTHDVVYLGDAAHAMSPQLGQGCNLALIDAATLADCLAAESSVAGALAAYSARRADHLDFYQLATRWLTPFFQSDGAALGLFRDALFGALIKVPYFARQMAESMAGNKLGLFRAMRELTPPDRG